MDQALHHLYWTPVIGSHSGHCDARHHLVRLHTPLVVDGLDHPAAEENLPGLCEGDLVELPPAVHVLAVPPVLRAELFLAGTVLDVGSHQPARQGSIILPGQRDIVEVRGLVS